MPSTQSPTPRPPALGTATATAVHLLVGAGRMPVITADVAEVVDQPVTYLRLLVDDTPRSGTRHSLDVSISGPPADVAALVASLAAAVEQADQAREG
jgi:hypothetical protein